jgi:hypothetical protein
VALVVAAPARVPVAAAAGAVAAPTLTQRDAALRIHAAVSLLPGRSVPVAAWRGALLANPGASGVFAAVDSIMLLAAAHRDLLRCARVPGLHVLSL